MTDTQSSHDEYVLRDAADAADVPVGASGIPLDAFWALLDPLPEDTRP